jgi:hypothetical protein
MDAAAEQDAAERDAADLAHGRYAVQWLPNPFATESIRDVRLLDLGLPIGKLGAKHPAFQPLRM